VQHHDHQSDANPNSDSSLYSHWYGTIKKTVSACKFYKDVEKQHTILVGKELGAPLENSPAIPQKVKYSYKRTQQFHSRVSIKV
jgi:hypothetical protein